MRILIAPDSFKGTLTAREAAEAMARGVREAASDAHVDLLPIADGGEGLIDVILAARDGERRVVRVTGPLDESVEAAFALIDGGATAIVESAAAIGLTLIPESRRDPLGTSSFGVGELILAAAASGANRVIVGIGGSSTNDGGLGMAQALGVTTRGVRAPARGGDLIDLTGIDVTTRNVALDHCEILAACDVTNPLLGPYGATHTYAPQKGATGEAIAQLEAGLSRLAELLPGIDPSRPGSGAAGGLGFGLAAFCGAKLVSGADLVLDLLELERRLTGVDLVLTGEGRMDGQSLHGKACISLARRARAAGVPVTAVVGSVGHGIEAVREHGIESWFAVSDESIRDAIPPRPHHTLLAASAARAIRTKLSEA